jgi:hypothetical protein
MASETLWSEVVHTDGAPPGGVAVSFFLGGDLADKNLRMVARKSSGMLLEVRQTHGWLDGTLDAGHLTHTYTHLFFSIHLEY